MVKWMIANLLTPFVLSWSASSGAICPAHLQNLLAGAAKKTCAHQSRDAQIRGSRHGAPDGA